MGSVEDFVKKYNLVIDNSKQSDKVVYIRSSISTEDEAILFVKKLGYKTQTAWCASLKCHKLQRLIFHRSFICRWGKQNSKRIGKQSNCEAKLDIKVKKVNKNNFKKDAFLKRKPPLPCSIRLHYKHNHNNKDDTNYLRLPDEVKDLFYGYFDNGFGVAKAIKMYEENLKNEAVQKSFHLTPKRRQIYYIYKSWLEKKRVTSIVCEDVEDYLVAVDIEDIIKAIPRENPPCPWIIPYKFRIPAIVFPDKTPDPHQELNNSHTDADKCVHLGPSSQKAPTVTPTLKTVISSGMVNPSSSVKQIVFVRRPISTQHISVNSPSHLNGSILTVVNSGPVIPFIPSLNSNQTPFSKKPRIDSVMSLQNNSSTSPNSSPNLETCSELSSDDSNSHSSASSFELSDDSCVILPDSSDNNVSENQEIKIETISDDSQSNVLESSTPYFTSASESSGTSFSNFDLKSSDLLSSASKINSSTEMCLPVLSISNSVIPKISGSVDSSYVLKYPSVSSNIYSSSSSIVSKSNSFSFTPVSTSSIYSTSSLTLNKSNSFSFTQALTTAVPGGDNMIDLKSDIDTQIVTNTVHQSGAHISVKSPSKSSQIPVLNAVHLSEPVATNISSVNDHIRIKEEPLDEYEKDTAMETENLDCLPTIASVSSVNGASNVVSKESLSMPQIKVESTENLSCLPVLTSVSSINAVPSIISTETATAMYINTPILPVSFLSGISSASRTTPSAYEDEDHQFLMSLLPEMRRIPKEAKVILKSQFQNLILSARLSALKKRTDVKNLPTIEKRPERITNLYHGSREINKIYHDCRILPSFPTFK